MGLLRTILVLIVLVILSHAGMVYVGVTENTNDLTVALYGLGELVELPVVVLLNAFPPNEIGFYTITLIAAAGYFILFLLLGVGKRR